MKRVPLAIALLLTLPLASLARTENVCKPCGSWQLDAAASEAVEPAIDAALARYKPPRIKRMRPNYGDIASETEAEFVNSLEDRPGPGDRRKLREELLRHLASPEQLTLSRDGGDILIEPVGGYRRRVTPGEPHARVDELGTARIAATWRGAQLTISEKYSPTKAQNRETYAPDAAKGLMLVTRSVSRPGLPTIVVRATYQMR